MKVNQSGVIPIIFASSILLLPAILASFLGNGDPNGGWWDQARIDIQTFVDQYILNSQNVVYITTVRAADHRLRLLLQLDRLRPGAPGRPDPPPGWLHPRRAPRTADRGYLAKAVNRITLPGAVFIAIIAILPVHPAVGRRRQRFPFAGTSVLISVGVALELMRQIDSQLMLRNYEGFLK